MSSLSSCRRTHHVEPSRQGGLAMLEVLIAALLFLVIMLGTLPLFTRAMTSNNAGSLATNNASDIRDAIETGYQVAWDQVVPGTVTEFAALGDPEWHDSLPPGETLRATRTTTTLQYHISHLSDGELSQDEADAWAGADETNVDLKEIRVNVLGEAEIGNQNAKTRNVTQSVVRSQ